MDEATAGTCVLAEAHGPVRVLTLNRPGRRNAIDLELPAVLAEAIEGAMADQAVRVVVPTGAGASAARRSSRAGDNLTLINKELAKTGGGAWPPPRGT